MPINTIVFQWKGNGKAKVIPEMKFTDRNGIGPGLIMPALPLLLTMPA